MKILFFGNRERGCLCLEAVVKAGHEVMGVVALPKEEQSSWCRSIISVARQQNIMIRYFEDRPFPYSHFYDKDQIRPDVVILAGWPRLVGPEIINLPTKMCINLHASPLPRYRGPHPLNWMLIRGEQKGGISIIEVDKGVDTGPIIAQQLFDIAHYWDYKNLLDYTLLRYPKMLVNVLKEIEDGTVKKKYQRKEEGFWCTRRYPNDGWIDWHAMKATEVHNLVRALIHPMPGAWAYTSKGEKVVIAKTELLERTYIGQPGRIAAKWKNGIVVVCEDRGLLITHCIDEDGFLIADADIFNGKAGDDLL